MSLDYDCAKLRDMANRIDLLVKRLAPREIIEVDADFLRHMADLMESRWGDREQKIAALERLLARYDNEEKV